MAQIFLIHGEERQLMEEKKQQILQRFKDHRPDVYTTEYSVQEVMNALEEDSLFGEPSVIILEDMPIVKMTTVKKGNADAWEVVYKAVMNYTGENPIILFMHGNIDKRVKNNKDILAVCEEFSFPKLTQEETMRWITRYCNDHRHALSRDGYQYMEGLLEIWVDVPIIFLKTELDRLFLFLGEHEEITAKLLAKEGSDYGSKNVFKFTEALYNKDMAMMMELLPFVSKTKEIDRFLAYLEGQLRLQLLVYEGRYNGKSANAMAAEFKEAGLSYKSYPVTLAFNRCNSISYAAVRDLLYGIYELTLERRTGNMDPHGLERLCIAYCQGKGK